MADWSNAPIIRAAPITPQRPEQIDPNQTPHAKVTTAVETEKGTSPVPTQQIYQDLSAARSQINTIDRQLNRVESLYNRSLKGSEPWRVIREYAPWVAPTSSVSKDVSRFDTAASQLYSLASQMTRVPGEGAQDRNEFLQKIEAFKPLSNDKDPAIEEKIRGLRGIIKERAAFIDSRLSEVRPASSPQMKAAKAAILPQKAVVIRYDAKGNRIP